MKLREPTASFSPEGQGQRPFAFSLPFCDHPEPANALLDHSFFSDCCRYLFPCQPACIARNPTAPSTPHRCRLPTFNRFASFIFLFDSSSKPLYPHRRQPLNGTLWDNWFFWILPRSTPHPFHNLDGETYVSSSPINPPAHSIGSVVAPCALVLPSLISCPRSASVAVPIPLSLTQRNQLSVFEFCFAS